MVHSGIRERTMQATKIEFRLRMVIMASLIVIGFWAPWIEAWRIGTRRPLLEWLPIEFSRHGVFSFAVATRLIIVVAALIAAKAMVFRIWGAAYLGPATVTHSSMRGDALVASGPYCHVRNPLYIGLCAMVSALAFLMPATGALFVLLAVPVFLLRLTLGEEAFLTAQLGEPYQEYLRAVPRLIPRLKSTLPHAPGKPQWLRAALSECTQIGLFLAFAVFAWSYDLRLMARVILVSFGVSLVARALLPGLPRTAGQG